MQLRKNPKLQLQRHNLSSTITTDGKTVLPSVLLPKPQCLPSRKGKSVHLHPDKKNFVRSTCQLFGQVIYLGQ